MILIGRYLSPFVRRCAVTLNFYQLAFEHLPLQHTGDDVPALKAYNPLGRVPALVLDDERVLVESGAILDYLDRAVGPARALTPSDGPARDRALALLGVATGALDKAITSLYEVRFRPEEKRHQPWVERCEEQTRGGFLHLSEQLQGDWYNGESMSQVDISVAVGWQFVGLAAEQLKASIDAPALDDLLTRMMAYPEFSSTTPT